MTMTEEEKARKELTEAHALIKALRWRNVLLARQFTFYIQYNQKVDFDLELNKNEALTLTQI